MCTAIKKGSKPSTAKKDIVVYKIGHPYGSCDIKGFVSLYQYFIYLTDELTVTDFTFSDDEGCSDGIEQSYVSDVGWDKFTFVVDGFHSYKSIERINQFSIWSDRVMKIGEFVIPKGAQYFENKAGNLVSNQIIFKRFI